MNRLLGNQADKSAFTVGDEDDDQSLGKEPEATTIPAAEVHLLEDDEQYRGKSAAAALNNGVTQVSPGEPGKGVETLRPNGAEKQRNVHTLSPHRTSVAEKFSGLNGRSEAALPEIKEGVLQLDRQTGAAPSSGQLVAEPLAVTVETTNGRDQQKAAPSPTTQQLSVVAANNNKKGPGGLDNTPLDSRTSAALNQEPAEPPNAQTVSSEAEEQRIADVRYHL